MRQDPRAGSIHKIIINATASKLYLALDHHAPCLEPSRKSSKGILAAPEEICTGVTLSLLAHSQPP